MTITVNGEKLEWRKGLTVQDVLHDRKYTYKMLVVLIDGKSVDAKDYATAQVPDNAKVDVIHLISGG